ncbi:MAG TPA: hypothetical protein VGS41_14945, partial [Chthonomonadales bacterium]|nr:hypothetical protein [Chthonomonadales bacterium]
GTGRTYGLVKFFYADHMGKNGRTVSADISSWKGGPCKDLSHALACTADRQYATWWDDNSDNGEAEPDHVAHTKWFCSENRNISSTTAHPSYSGAIPCAAIP